MPSSAWKSDRSEEHTSELQSHSHLVACRIIRSEEHTSELQSHSHLVCRLLLEKKKRDRKSTRLNSSHTLISYGVFCLKKRQHKTDHLEQRASKTDKTTRAHSPLHSVLLIQPPATRTLLAVCILGRCVTFFNALDHVVCHSGDRSAALRR